MKTFHKLKNLKKAFQGLQGIQTCKDFEIAVEIGYHEEVGAPLTLKQLQLLNIASPATVRRHLARMVKEGLVIKQPAASDHRIVNLMLSSMAHQALQDYVERITQALHAPSGATEVLPGHD